MLKGRVGLLSCNSGCQVSKEATARLRPDSSPGLFNCLSLLQTCDMQAGRQQQQWSIREVLVGSADAGLLGGLRPSSRGPSAHSCSLRRRWPDSGYPPLSIPSFPSGPILSLPVPPPASQFLSEVIYSTIMSLSLTHPPLFSFRTSPSARPQQGAVNSLRSANFHTFFQARDADTSSEAPSGSANSALLRATPFFTLAQPRRLAGAFREAWESRLACAIGKTE